MTWKGKGLAECEQHGWFEWFDRPDCPKCPSAPEAKPSVVDRPGFQHIMGAGPYCADNCPCVKEAGGL